MEGSEQREEEEEDGAELPWEFLPKRKCPQKSTERVLGEQKRGVVCGMKYRKVVLVLYAIV
jgi:hypothetical protein